MESEEEKKDVYRSTKTWVELNLPENLMRSIELNGWASPTKIQGEAIPYILSGRNVIAQSKNGTGKTGAFVVGVLGKLDPYADELQAICMSHTRELNQQNYQVFCRLAEGAEFKIALAQKGERELPKCQILCGTLGIIAKLLKSRSTSSGMLESIKTFIYDEADTMFEEGDNKSIVAAIKGSILHPIQQLLFSATFETNVLDFIQKEIPNPVELRLGAKSDMNLDNVLQFVIQCNQNEKFDIVYNILRNVRERACCIIFVNTTDFLDQLYNSLSERGYKVHVLAAQRMSPENRDLVIQKFRRGEITVLVSTNLTSRGIDVRLVNLVINLDAPLTRERKGDPVTYIHRVGRTGRYGRKGVAVNIVSNQLSQTAFKDIQDYYGVKFQSCTVDNLVGYLEEIKDDYANLDKAI